MYSVVRIIVYAVNLVVSVVWCLEILVFRKHESAAAEVVLVVEGYTDMVLDIVELLVFVSLEAEEQDIALLDSDILVYRVVAVDRQAACTVAGVADIAAHEDSVDAAVECIAHHPYISGMLYGVCHAIGMLRLPAALAILPYQAYV